MMKKKLGLLSVLALGLAMGTAGCSDDDDGFSAENCKGVEGPCYQIKGGDVDALLERVNTPEENMTIVLGQGTYMLDSEITLEAGMDGLSLLGQGRLKTTLDFSGDQGNGNGISGIGVDDILVQGFTVIDSTKDGIRIEDSDRVVFRDIGATWSAEKNTRNGAYGIYPVKVKDVLVEDSFASNASDAGLYVGQCQRAIVRNNEVRGNVAGLEIENTQYAEVYNNHVENNTGGLVVFDLPGNPVAGHDILMYNNTIINNNLGNFAPKGSIVGEIPAGVGTFVMASRRVKVYDNVYENNNTVDIAILDGIIGDQGNTHPRDWAIPVDEMLGDWKHLDANGDTTGYGLDLCYDEEDENYVPEEGKEEEGIPTIIQCYSPGDAKYDEATAKYASNWRAHNVVITGNTHKNTGTDIDATGEFGAVIYSVYKDADHVDHIVYDASSEPDYDAEGDPNDLSNRNHICVGGMADDATFGVVRLLDFGKVTLTKDGLYSFDCHDLIGGVIKEVRLEGVEH